MIAHALTIIVNELNHQLVEAYGISSNATPAGLHDLSSANAQPATREGLNLTLVNIQEDAGLKNSPPGMTPSHPVYQSPPLQLNLLVLLSATYASYTEALLMLGRAMQFFHAQPLFSEMNVKHESMTHNAPTHALDRLREFKLAIDLYSPTLEETHDVWSTLKAVPVPSALYKCRLLTVATDAPDTKVLPMLERRLPTPNRDKN